MLVPCTECNRLMDGEIYTGDEAGAAVAALADASTMCRQCVERARLLGPGEHPTDMAVRCAYLWQAAAALLALQVIPLLCGLYFGAWVVFGLNAVLLASPVVWFLGTEWRFRRYLRCYYFSRRRPIPEYWRRWVQNN